MNITVTAIIAGISILLIIFLTSKARLNAFISLFLVSIFLAFATLPAEKVLGTLKEGFGGTMASIGFLIIFGAIIGITLDKTGAMLSIAGWILSGTGRRNSPAAIGLTGFLAGMPIFCDSGFIILSGLAKSFSRNSGIAMPFMATVLATSLYSVHCLIPPHPGASAAAGIMGAGAGNLILAGIVFAVPGALAAYFWSRFACRKSLFMEPEKDPDFFTGIKPLPPVLLSLLPVAIPLLLITGASVYQLFDPSGEGWLPRIVSVAGNPVMALFAGMLFSLLLLKDRQVVTVNEIISLSIEKAGPILIITAAGGMFGMVIRSTGAGEELGRILSGSGAGLLVPFLVAAIMKTAQGSSTVAIITAASFVVPMLPTLGLDTETGKLLATLAMGAGSMIVSHANDSYFWVVTNFSEISVNATLKVFTTSTAVMGITVFAFIYLSSLFLL